MSAQEIACPSLPTLDAETVAVVATQLTAPEEQLEQLFSCLSADELARQERFLLPDIRRRFGVCRARLRYVLAQLLEIAPADVKFSYNALGKPALADAHSSPLQFNVSHSEDWGLFAFTKSSPVGADIEIPKARTKFLNLAPQVLSERELAAIASLPVSEKELQIKLAWVAKESILKAMGIGIGTGMRSVELHLPLEPKSSPRAIAATLLERMDDDGTCSMISWIDASAWVIHQIDVRPQAYAAITCVPGIKQISLQMF